MIISVFSVLAQEKKSPGILTVADGKKPLFNKDKLEKIKDRAKGLVQIRIDNCVKRTMKLNKDMTKENALQACKVKLKSIRPISFKLKKPSLKIYKEELAFKARKIKTTRLEVARKNYKSAKANLLKVKNNLKRATSNFKSLKKELINCKGKTKCDNVKKKFLERGKKFFSYKVDLYINHLTKVKSRIDSNEYINNTKASGMVLDLDKNLEQLKVIKKNIEDASSKADLIKAVKDLEKQWKIINRRAKSFVGLHSNHRLGGVVVKSKKLESRLDFALAKMKEKGASTTSVDSLVSDFKKEIAVAETSFEDARKMFEKMRDVRDFDESAKLHRDAMAKMKDAKKSLQKAQKTLKSIWAKLKEHNALGFLKETPQDPTTSN